MWKSDENGVGEIYRGKLGLYRLIEPTPRPAPFIFTAMIRKVTSVGYK